MILEALRVLLFGMLGIFLVMAIIYGVIVALSRFSSRFNKGDDTEGLAAEDLAGEDLAAEGVAIEEEAPVEHYVVTEEYVVGDEYVDEYGDEYAVAEYYPEGEYVGEVEVVEA